ncbi:MAG: PQQ-binding-like beta-propeller repeat protein [Acidimicrobiaceae bacterium]|nr:PQQ-binding-like beta-propeller repeat protein [Acidimicrobiaceae bacterium]
MRNRLVRHLWAIAACAALLALLFSPSAASASSTSAAATPPAYTWPEFHANAALTGVNADPSLTATNASTLGVRWMEPTRAAVFSSPVVAWSTTLKKTLVYVVNEAGYVTAFDEATGAVVWSQTFQVPIRATPLVDGSDLWVATDQNSHLYKMNASTGAVECSAVLPLAVESSPVDGTPPGGVDTVYVATNDGGSTNGPVIAVTASNCQTQWSFSAYGANPANCHGCAGVWGSLAFGVAGNGRAEITLGTADPDTSIYALDALTGAKLWRVKAPIIAPNDGDCGAGITISHSGQNGFADGVAYGECKNGIMFAIDLVTGTVLWQSNFAGVDGSPPGARSTPALSGNTLVSGDLTNAFALDASTGRELWHFPTGGFEVLGAPAIIGPAGNRLVAIDDVSGMFRVLRLSDGTQVYQHQLGDYSVSSVAETDGNLITTASDGYVYDFALNGGNGPAPTTTVTSPANGSTVANPDGNLTISGTATATNGVQAVHVAVQENGSQGQWWNAGQKAWTPGIDQQAAVLTNPGGKQSRWSITVPVPLAGDNLQVFASAVDGHIADISAEEPAPTSARSSFAVAADPSVPTLTGSSAWMSPGGSYQIKGSGWQAGEAIQLRLGDVALQQVTASASGALPATTITIPATAGYGPSSVIATGSTSPATSFPVYVSNEWAQWRDGPTKTGTEVNDVAIGKNTAYNHVNYLQEAWIYQSGGSVGSSPAVFHGVAYFGNGKGLLTALSVHTAMPLWTYQAAGFVDSSPAVDSGLVIVGTGANSIIALNASTGALVWQTSVGGSVQSSPAVSNGVVYVGSDAGHVYALNEATGAMVWNTPLKGIVHSSPAIDPTTGLLFVGDNSGAVTALSMATGAVRWSAPTGGAVTATPAVSKGQVVVGSADGNVYSLAENTGTTTWSFATGGPVTASVVVDPVVGYLVVGSQSGLYAELNPGDGSAAVSRNLGTPFVGLSEAAGPQNALIVAQTSTGIVYGIKPKQVGDISWEWSGTGALTSSPSIVNSVVYVTGQDGTLRAFTIPGKPVY